VSATALKNSGQRERNSDTFDMIPFLLGGVLLGAVAIMVCALVNGMMIAIFEQIAVGDEGRPWPVGFVIAAGVFAVLLSLLIGRWVFGLRRWIGTNGDPADLDTIRRKRRSFTIGSMTMYSVITPFIWVMVVAIANTVT
jgi:hypothetical protein